MGRAADRIAGSKPYIFQTLARRKAEALARGVDVIDLGVGNPDLPPAPELIRELHDALDDREAQLHRYPSFDGLPELREAIVRWYRERFGVEGLDARSEALPLIGTKEGIGHLYLALLNPGDVVLVPTPCYPAYLGAAGVAQAEVVEMPLLAENGFRVDVSRIPPEAARRAKLLLLNYPGNPTGACAGLDHYREVLEFAERYDLVVVSDIAYADLVLDEGAPAPSILEIPGAKDRAVEFYSFSKTFGMAGWRVGFVAGSSEVIGLLLKLKSNLDFGVFLAVQRAAARILTGSRKPIDDLKAIYRRRRDLMVEGLRNAGWNVDVPPATLYLWTRIPPGFPDSMTFTEKLFDETGVQLSPGSAFGASGEGWCRISLVVDEERTREAVRRVKESGVLGVRTG
ncbi:MAG TPA: aminotransferase class I/II-fold pyridoxal phosphate-dependent enzyme [bacterium]|nr:aminotransferase class I/II-fold pyridoxal phosphate-dependent enzyme [bacterium]